MSRKIRFLVTYGQFVVFWSALKEPFNDWTEQHVAQGFAWRPGSIAFRTLTESGMHTVEVRIIDHVGHIHPKTVRAIDVPFEVPENGEIEIGSITESIEMELPAGEFLLRCELLETGNQEPQVRLSFGRGDKRHFSVVRADSALSPGEVLLTTAHAAK